MITDDNDEIPTFVIVEDPNNDDKFSDLLHMESCNDNFMEPEYNDDDIAIAAMDDPAPPSSRLEPISID